MFFLSLIVSSGIGLLAPWWVLLLVAILVGLTWPLRLKDTLQCGLAAGLSHAGLAFYFDGLQRGIVSVRLAGLFQMPWPELIYLLAGFISFVSVILGLSLGARLRPVVMRR